jgi:hypothetical protein
MDKSRLSMKAQNEGARAHWLTHFSTWIKGCFQVAPCLAVLFFVLSWVDIMSSPVVVNEAAETWFGGETSGSMWYGLVSS